MNTNFDRIIPITDLRRNFGEITANLAETNGIILTKGGEPFAVLQAVPSVKKKILKKSCGAWKGTKLDDSKVWKEVFKRKSRKEAIAI